MEKEDNRIDIERERPRLLRYACYRLGNADDAEDAVQDVLLRMQSAVSRPERPVAYLYRSLANLCASRMRGQRVGQVSLEEAKHLACEEPADFSQEFQRISQLLAMIPDEQQEVIRLRFHCDKSFAEIADILGVPLATAKSRFRYGMEKLRSSMARQIEN